MEKGEGDTKKDRILKKMIKKQEKIRHEIWMQRLLIEILDDKRLSTNIFFKGGTCASMLGYLDRFSVDLDFDLNKDMNKTELRKILHNIFNKLDLKIKDESKTALQFFLKYDSESEERNTIKIEILDNYYKTNKYRAYYIEDIKRTAMCQTIETMFSHKLVAPIDRYKKGGSIAGRDIYDIHHFFLKGYNYHKEIIEERRGVSLLNHLIELRDFIDKKITLKVIDEDINILLEYSIFKKIRKYLKEETLKFINNEIGKIK